MRTVVKCLFTPSLLKTSFDYRKVASSFAMNKLRLEELSSDIGCGLSLELFSLKCLLVKSVCVLALSNSGRRR